MCLCFYTLAWICSLLLIRKTPKCIKIPVVFNFQLQREVDLILGLKRMPPRLQVLKAYDCGGVLLAHLTQLCRQQLRVLVTSVFMHENDFSNLAATVTQMPK